MEYLWLASRMLDFSGPRACSRVIGICRSVDSYSTSDAHIEDVPYART